MKPETHKQTDKRLNHVMGLTFSRLRFITYLCHQDSRIWKAVSEVLKFESNLNRSRLEREQYCSIFGHLWRYKSGWSRDQIPRTLQRPQGILFEIDSGISFSLL